MSTPRTVWRRRGEDSSSEDDFDLTPPTRKAAINKNYVEPSSSEDEIRPQKDSDNDDNAELHAQLAFDDDDEQADSDGPRKRGRAASSENAIGKRRKVEDDSDFEIEVKHDSDGSPSPASDSDDVNFGSRARKKKSRKRAHHATGEKRPRRSRSQVPDDDEEYSASDNSSDNEGSNDSGVSERDEDPINNFVEDDEDVQPVRRSNRHRGLGRRERIPIATADDDDDDDKRLSLAVELAELRRNDPPPIRKKTLRARKAVNYQILPPPTVDEPFNADEAGAAAPTRRRGGNNNALRRLIPTVGPFGGGDVMPLFGTNVPGLTAVGGADDDDSSDDEKIKGIQGAPGIAKKKNAVADTDPLGVDMNIDFTHVGGLDNHINQLKEMVMLPMMYPEIFKRFNTTPPRGVLFHGPPGTGKTLLARALAASCSTEGRNITFFMRKGADCLSKWVGEAERQLRLLFEEAKNQQPSIIFFDEIDGLAPVRSSKQEQIHASIVSTILALMDGMDNRGQVIVIGATNRPDSVDPALRRPGRFDREFYFPLPDKEARKAIIGIHTNKWSPPLEPKFVDHVAGMTKGYGGADLKTLCTESAINAIQRTYPQIYSSHAKLTIDPATINVRAADILLAVDKIVPSSARSSSSGATPLPPTIAPLLQKTVDELKDRLDSIVPRKKKLTALEEALFEEFPDEDGGFARIQRQKLFEKSRTCRPKLLITGDTGMGQQYIGSALLHHLEGFHIQQLDLGSLYADSSRTVEATLAQIITESRRHAQSVLYIPNIEFWPTTLSSQALSIFYTLMRQAQSQTELLVLGISEMPYDELPGDLKSFFGVAASRLYPIQKPSLAERRKYFEGVEQYIVAKPTDYPDPATRKKRKLPILPVAPPPPPKELTASDVKTQQKKDMQLKNVIKVKLSGLMELFKNRYKRFRKPPIDDIHVAHLFEPDLDPQAAALHDFRRTDDDMILQVSTGKKYYNYDLDVIEDRVWNGFYSELKQFLKDIEYIYLDSITSGDRERKNKASEMFANAQVAIEEMSIDQQFVADCKKMRQREVEAQEKWKVEQARVEAAEAQAAAEQYEAEQRLAAEVQEREVDGDDGDPDASQMQVDGEGVVEVGEVKDGEVKDEEMADVEPEVPVQAVVTAEPVVEPVVVAEPVVEPVAVTETAQSEPVVTEVAEVTETTATVNGHTNGTVEEKTVAEIAPPVEATPSPPPSPDPPLIVDAKEAQDVVDFLASNTAELTIEELEQVYAAIIDIIWAHRASWDRNVIINAITAQLDEIVNAFQE
ncbi:putative AAA domain-containing protein [Yarrowia sp. C11]|nr:putative AAA domain-containing protein [Yarrowia sp. C11]KAG5364304.1 putative AAA domain-containing protein [Yarrowia sp. E02]